MKARILTPQLLVIAIALAFATFTTAQGEERPNILWISCEDISPNLGCYGDDYARTPNLDRLAGQGVRFDRAFTHAGVCAVLRSGVITGVYPISIGSQHMRSNIIPPPHIKCF
ncbi:MAG: sulfatase-like hydrolase/transferase, partial [Planctomycetota bacterium]|nr:sulfatase-like hydrolase/transferase [Planctomycetota bacterium]